MPILLHTKAMNEASAQPAVPADRFAREIVGMLTRFSSALAAAERQSVGPCSTPSSFPLHRLLTSRHSRAIFHNILNCSWIALAEPLRLASATRSLSRSIGAPPLKPAVLGGIPQELFDG
jgi:hypothetical protein